MTTINKPLGIYIHIPFCKKKCAYCDFLSFETESAVIHKAYTKALIKEIEARGAELNGNAVNGNKYFVNSIFIGGGTPSILLPSMINDVITAVKDSFNTDINMEVTIEANPGTLSELKIKSYLKSGINRLSIGAQSFNDFILKILRRAHFSDDIYTGFKMAREIGFDNINLDLMFAIPGQTIELWADTLSKAIELEPEHISFYGLQIEEGTKFYEMFVKGPYEKISDELDREMYHYAVEKLQGSGYEHYEISNAAKAGYECRHNIKYWSMDEYLGFGLGAHSYISGKRYGNIRGFDEYIELAIEKADYEKLRESSQKNSFSDDVSEYMFTGLRKTKGISLDDFKKRFKKPIEEVYYREWPAIERYIKSGFLVVDGCMMNLSEKGIDISNKVMSEFILIHPAR